MHLGTIDYDMEVAAGRVSGEGAINKFGRAPSGIQTTATDVWDRADATPTQQLWLAPTAARIHTIASDSANDDDAGTGANTVIVTYMADWDSMPAEETVTGDLNAGIVMVNAAVIIHRMKVVPQSTSTTPNAGTITATAASDATVTAAIRPGVGQTTMAIYGIPSTCNLYIKELYATMLQGVGATVTSNMNLLVNPNPDTQTLTYLVKHTWGAVGAGSSESDLTFSPYKKIEGPAIVKIEGTASSADTDVSAGFNGTLQRKNA